jgi:hypothetical protein
MTLISIVAISLLIVAILKHEPPPPAPRPAVRALDFEEFAVNAGEERLTVLVGPGTYHEVWANKPFIVLSQQPDNRTTQRHEMPSGTTGLEGHEPRGLLRIKGISDETIVRFRKAS